MLHLLSSAQLSSPRSAEAVCSILTKTMNLLSACINTDPDPQRSHDAWEPADALPMNWMCFFIFLNHHVLESEHVFDQVCADPRARRTWHFAGYELKIVSSPPLARTRWITCALTFPQATCHLSHTPFPTRRRSESTWHRVWNTTRCPSNLQDVVWRLLQEKCWWVEENSLSDSNPRLFSVYIRENILLSPGSYVEIHSEAGSGGMQSQTC